jgi:uncharacterized metal-binding protein YceD (DUF177 family)
MDLKTYIIPFTGLKLGKHSFTYHVDSKFFEVFQYDDFNTINCDVVVTFNKKPRFFELHFDIKGVANLNCDLSNEVFDQNLESFLDLIIRFGDVFNDENEEILVLPHGAHEVNVSQYIYEAIVLGIPIKRIHPGITDGSLKSKVLEKLEEYKIRETTKTDPRWDKLNDLLTKNKQ